MMNRAFQRGQKRPGASTWRAGLAPCTKQSQTACRSSRVPPPPSNDDSADDGTWALPCTDSTTDWREFRAQLVSRSRTTEDASTSDRTPTWPASPASTLPSASSQASPSSSDSWCHCIAAPESGCILVANPLLFSNSQTYFDKCVILVVQHTEQGSMGIILNKPSDVRLGVLDGVKLGTDYGIFQDNVVNLGGDVGDDAFYMLHGHAVPSGAEVRPGVYIGGLDHLVEAVQRGDIEASSIKFFARYAGWGPGQLEAECKRNVWYPMSCSKDVILSPLQGSGCEMWHQVMDLTGGDYARVSQQVRATTLRREDAC